MSFDQIFVKDATNKIIEVLLRDATTGQGKPAIAFGTVTAYYMREGAAAALTITMVSAVLGTYTSGGWVEVDATNLPGLYQFGIPNAALASGADAATLFFQVSGALNRAIRVVTSRITVNADQISGSAVAASNSKLFFDGTGYIPAANAIADAVLSRGVSNVQDTADTTSLAAVILATFESAVVGTDWVIRKTSGATFVVKTLTIDAAADPVIGVA